MTICCNCGRHFYPGQNRCPGRAQQRNALAKACNHMPCENCQPYVDEKEKSYERHENESDSV